MKVTLSAFALALNLTLASAAEVSIKPGDSQTITIVSPDHHTRSRIIIDDHNIVGQSVTSKELPAKNGHFYRRSVSKYHTSETIPKEFVDKIIENLHAKGPLRLTETASELEQESTSGAGKILSTSGGKEVKKPVDAQVEEKKKKKIVWDRTGIVSVESESEGESD